MEKIIVIDSKRCLSCRSCELACAVAHSESKDLVKSIKEKTAPQKRVTVESVGSLAVPLQCRHCEDAPCITVCPTRAIDRTNLDSPVLVDSARCIGCKWCIIVCPFGVIKTDKKGKAIIKCDLCIERLNKNLAPACVEACPTKTLKFVNISEFSKSKRKKFLVNLTSDSNER